LVYQRSGIYCIIDATQLRGELGIPKSALSSDIKSKSLIEFLGRTGDIEGQSAVALEIPSQEIP
jgi:hypothetical protein